jgi:hypothetical protein
MAVIYRRCYVCNADPAARWATPAKMIFIDLHHKDNRQDPGAKFRCREHLSAKREEEIARREYERGWPQEPLR